MISQLLAAFDRLIAPKDEGAATAVLWREMEDQTTRAEKAEALVEKLRADVEWFRRDRNDWQQRARKLAALLTDERRQRRAEQTTRRETAAAQHPADGAERDGGDAVTQETVENGTGRAATAQTGVRAGAETSGPEKGAVRGAEGVRPASVLEELHDAFRAGAYTHWTNWHNEDGDYRDCCHRAGLAAVLTQLGLREEWGNEYLDDAGKPMFGPMADEQSARWSVGHFPISGPVWLARRFVTKPGRVVEDGSEEAGERG
jgi:hypothetical protein